MFDNEKRITHACVIGHRACKTLGLITFAVCVGVWFESGGRDAVLPREEREMCELMSNEFQRQPVPENALLKHAREGRTLLIASKTIWDFVISTECAFGQMDAKKGVAHNCKATAVERVFRYA